jgi:hypothetical protein
MEECSLVWSFSFSWNSHWMWNDAFLWLWKRIEWVSFSPSSAGSTFEFC